MQQVQQRETPERISWARAIIFGVGFFFLAAILIGQLPGYINLEMTAASLEGFEQGMLALGVVCIAGFVVILVIVSLFDPKPIVPPILFTVLGVPLALIGLALMLWATTTGCTPQQQACNQYFPAANTVWNPVLGGTVLWFQPNAVDFVMLGTVILGVGVAFIFYSQLALRELRNPDRSDPGTTPAIRWMIIAGATMLVIFMVAYAMVNDQGLAYQINSARPFFTQKIIDFIVSAFLGVAIFLTLGAFALRLHYLMRPIRKRTMSALYAVGALGLAQAGVIFLLAWFLIYPLIAWIHGWTFIGLGDYLTICARKSAVPASCAFSPQAGYLIDAIVTTNSFVVLMAAVWVWRLNRNLVIVGGVVVAAMLALATLVVHLHPDEYLIGLLLCGGALVLAAVWTSVARREFAVVGENNLGCIGQWLVVGTCLFIYLASFAFFSIPGFRETEPNIPFVSGSIVPPHVPAGQPPVITQSDAVVTLIVMGILAAIQFYFLVRNRYKV
jgi:hypothetical protein